MPRPVAVRRAPVPVARKARRSGWQCRLALGGGITLSLNDLASKALSGAYALHQVILIRAFVGIDLGRESAPDATTLLKFRHLLEANKLTRQIFEST